MIKIEDVLHQQFLAAGDTQWGKWQRGYRRYVYR